MSVLVTGTTRGVGKYLAQHFKADTWNRDEPWPYEKHYKLIIHCVHDRMSAAANYALMHHVLAVPAERIIYLSSVDVYQALRASDDAYTGVSKLECERLLRSTHDDYLILRLGALIGPYMRPNNLTALLRGEQMTLAPESTLAFVRYAMLARWLQDNLSRAGTITLTGNPIKLEDIAKRLMPGHKPRWGSHVYRTLWPASPVFDSMEEVEVFQRLDLQHLPPTPEKKEPPVGAPPISNAPLNSKISATSRPLGPPSYKTPVTPTSPDGISLFNGSHPDLPEGSQEHVSSDA